MKQNLKKFSPSKYPYMESDGKREHCVRTAVNCQGKWYSANVLEGGYSVIGMNEAKSEEEANHWSKVHNDYIGFSDEYINECLSWSFKIVLV